MVQRLRQSWRLGSLVVTITLGGYAACASKRPDFGAASTAGDNTSTSVAPSGVAGEADAGSLTAGETESAGLGSADSTSHVVDESTSRDDAVTSGDDEGTSNEESSSVNTAGEGSGTETGAAREIGVTCSEDEQCASDFCVDGVCCESACEELCAACNTSENKGQCVGVDVDERCTVLPCSPDTDCVSYVPDDAQANCAAVGQCLTEAQCATESAEVGTSCQSGDGQCDGKGECVVPNKAALGASCSEGEECGSTFCAESEDGESICCDTACDGLCQACAGDGHCTGAPADDSRCALIECPESTECVNYPADKSSDRCVGAGVCLTEAAYCVAQNESEGSDCTEGGRDGTCDNAGACIPTPVCGDSFTEGTEECDDGNDSNTDGCTTSCKDAKCGDGFVQATSGELCDDGNLVNGDGCSSGCVGGFAPKGSSMLTSVHLCGIRSNKTMGCWGLNTSGQLGSGSTSSSLETTRTVLNVSDAVDVALYGDTTCAVRSTGQVSCWGSGFTASPTTLSGISDAKQISAGDGVFCARRATGTVACWGTNGVVSEPYGYSNIVQVAQGNSHGCAIRGDGAIYCVGANAAGEGGRSGALGGARMTSATAATLLNTGTQLAAGYRYTCYIRTGGASVECVGDSATLGNPSAASGVNPVTVLNIPDPEKLASGGQHVCALTKAGKVLCWGQGSAAGPESVNATPVEVSLPSLAIDVGAGSQTSCALLEDGATYCWGLYAPTAESETPVQVTL